MTHLGFLMDSQIKILMAIRMGFRSRWETNSAIRSKIPMGIHWPRVINSEIPRLILRAIRSPREKDSDFRITIHSVTLIMTHLDSPMLKDLNSQIPRVILKLMVKVTAIPRGFRKKNQEKDLSKAILMAKLMEIHSPKDLSSEIRYDSRMDFRRPKGLNSGFRMVILKPIPKVTRSLRVINSVIRLTTLREILKPRGIKKDSHSTIHLEIHSGIPMDFPKPMDSMMEIQMPRGLNSTTHWRKVTGSEIPIMTLTDFHSPMG